MQMNLLLSKHTCLPQGIARVRPSTRWWEQPGFHLLAALLIIAMLIGMLKSESESGSGVPMIGQTVRIEIAGIPLLARVDTGAASSSLHACDVRIRDGMVHFTTYDDHGRAVPMQAPFVKQDMVRSASGGQERVFVALVLRHNTKEQSVIANLTDRSNVNYRMLLGRDWLGGNYLVDVSRPPHAPESAPAQCPGEDVLTAHLDAAK
jgi:hypothetical protein